MEATATYAQIQQDDGSSQKRVLWIVVAAGIFLLAVFGAALLLYSGSSQEPKPITVKKGPEPEYDGISLSDGNSSLENPYLTEGENSGAENALGGLGIQPNSGSDGQGEAIYTDGSNYYTGGTTIDLNKKTVEPSPVTPMNKAGEDALAAARKKQPAPKASPAAAAKPAASAKAAAPAAASSSSASSKAHLWIQAGSFISQKRADEARAFLAEKKISADIFTKVVDGRTFFRVRIGPYATDTEAKYWLNRIKEFEQFNEAIIFDSTAKAQN